MRIITMRNFVISLLAIIMIGGQAKAKGAAVSWKHITPKMLRGKVAYIQGNKLKCMNPDGSGKHVILSDAKYMDEIRFSPDLTHIVYSYARPNDDPYLGTEIFSIKIDGSGKRQLTKNKYQNVFQHSRYSSDGKKIVYARWSGGHMGGPMTSSADIWIMNADGSDNHRLIGDYLRFENGYAYSKPFWSKDGKTIFCERTKGAFPESTDYQAEASEPTIVSLDGKENPAGEGYESKYLLDDISHNGQKRISVTQSEKYTSDAVVQIIDNKTGSKTKLAVLHNSYIMNTFFTTDDKKVIFSQLEWGEPQIERIWQVNIDGSDLTCLIQSKTEELSLVQVL
ncbi:MAG: hypothetical protein ABI210_11580 [Abditibacteriaceae bacterium]